MTRAPTATPTAPAPLPAPPRLPKSVTVTTSAGVRARRRALPELWASRELLSNLTQRELRGKYKRSTLGWAWSLINPIALAIMFTLVFSVVFKSKLPPGRNSGLTSFPLFLLAGLLPWNFVSNGINGSIGALVSNSNLVKKVYFPREILVISNVLSWDVSLAIELSVLSIAFLVVGSFVVLWLPLVVLLMALLTCFVVGMGLALSVLNVYFRDVQHFVAIALQLWFYATPIVYPYSFITAHVVAHHNLETIHLLWIYKINPMVGFANSFHAALFDRAWPAWTDITWPAIASLGTLYLGHRLFSKLEPRLAEEL